MGDLINQQMEAAHHTTLPALAACPIAVFIHIYPEKDRAWWVRDD
jgi:hypothetical protein